MPEYRVSIANHKAGAVPKDWCVNTLYFHRDTAPTSAQLQTMVDALQTAFSALPLANGSLDLRAYNMADVKPRPILYEKTVAFTDQASGPPEVALCLSYYSGRNLPRTRGRIYVGPWQGTLTGTPAPISTVTGYLVTLAHAINTAATASGFVWCMHSVKDNDYLTISAGWVDNAWDTQRRRGVTATTRTTYAIP